MSEWSSILLEPARTVLSQISQLVMNLLLVLFVLLIGWIIANIIKGAVTKILRSIKLDELSVKVELDSLLAKGGIKYSLSELIGVVCYWIFLLMTLVVAIDIMGLSIAAELLQKIILYVPNIIAAIFILILGMFVSTVLRNVVQTAATNAGLSQVNILSRVVEFLVIAFAVVTAMKQLRIDTRFIELAMGIMLGSLGLAAGLAFGLGCKEQAGKFMHDLVEKIKAPK